MRTWARFSSVCQHIFAYVHIPVLNKGITIEDHRSARSANISPLCPLTPSIAFMLLQKNQPNANKELRIKLGSRNNRENLNGDDDENDSMLLFNVPLSQIQNMQKLLKMSVAGVLQPICAKRTVHRHNYCYSAVLPSDYLRPQSHVFR